MTTAETQESTPATDAAEPSADVDASAPPEAGASTEDSAAPAEGKDGEKVAPVKEETPEEKAEREKQADFAQRFKLVEKAKRDQLRIMQERTQLQTKESQVVQREQSLEAKEAHLSQREARIAKLEKAVADKDLEVLSEFGYSYQELTRHYLEANTPEGMARAASARAEKLEKELRGRDERAQADARVQETRRAAQTAVQIVEECAAEFPNLAVLPPERVAQDAIATRDGMFRQFGRMPTYDQVLSHMEKAAKDFNDAVESRKTKLAQQASSKPSGNGKPVSNGNGHQASRPGTPTLTNQDAATKATPPRKLSDAELDDWAVEQLRQMNRGKGARP